MKTVTTTTTTTTIIKGVSHLDEFLSLCDVVLWSKASVDIDDPCIVCSNQTSILIFESISSRSALLT